ncbi:MAG TPA: alpha/beta hydrolase-fold protein [Mycobacterium sp.]|nr:alpha/beta hydrolase-fold protein [Mycobacterium sp.]
MRVPPSAGAKHGQATINGVPITRRAALLAGLGVVLAACGDGGPSVGTWTHGSFESALRGGARTGWAILYPPGHDNARLPVLVVLHGRAGDHTDAYRSLHLDQYLAAAVRRGVPPFAIASVDGGDHDYWHPRRDADPAGMVVHEFLPLLAGHGLEVRRVGLLGWSMGGYGALYLAGVLRAGRCAVAVAESPAIWHHARQSVEGAFDAAADFDRHRIFGRQALLQGIALRVDCGDQDGFAPVTRDLRASISPTPAGGIEPGGHDVSYWRDQAPAQLAFAGRHLR